MKTFREGNTSPFKTKKIEYTKNKSKENILKNEGKEKKKKLTVSQSQKNISKKMPIINEDKGKKEAL